MVSISAACRSRAGCARLRRSLTITFRRLLVGHACQIARCRGASSQSYRFHTRKLSRRNPDPVPSVSPF
jgi:hypothetical protein